MIIVERTAAETPLARFLAIRQADIDKGLPPWARRSNPIIRRHLGLYWKTILPEAKFLRQAFIVQVGLMLLTIPLPGLIDLSLPLITASILLFPFALSLYAHVLANIGTAAARAMTDEFQNNTLNLLLVTPFQTETIIASKVAAAIWRQVEDLGLLLTAAALMSMPLLISQYAMIWPFDEHPLLARAAIIVGLGVSLLRLALEPFMIGVIGILMGAAIRQRSGAVISAIVTTGFYFLLLNLLRLAAMDTAWRLLVEFALPLLLPLLIVAGGLHLTRYCLARAL